MPTSEAKSPVQSVTTGAVAKGAQTSVDMRVGGRDISYVSIVASQDPDAGDTHELRINEAAGDYIDVPSTSAVAVRVEDVPANGPYMIRTVWLTSGKDGTTFRVEGLL